MRLVRYQVEPSERHMFFVIPAVFAEPGSNRVFSARRAARLRRHAPAWRDKHRTQVLTGFRTRHILNVNQPLAWSVIS